GCWSTSTTRCGWLPPPSTCRSCSTSTSTTGASSTAAVTSPSSCSPALARSLTSGCLRLLLQLAAELDRVLPARDQVLAEPDRLFGRVVEDVLADLVGQVREPD